MVLLDIIIEPIAIKLDFWTWADVAVPIQNYVMWFFTAFIINLLVASMVREFSIKTSFFVFGIQVYFFAMLNLIL